MGFPGGSVIKNLPIMQETQESWVQSLGQEDPLQKGMVTHSSILSWRIPWREEPGELQSMGSQESDMTEHVHRTRNRSVQFSHSVVSDSLQSHGLQHTRLPFPSPIARAYSNSHPSRQWCHPTISSSVVPLPAAPLNLSQPQCLFQWVSSSHQVTKGLEFQLQHQSFQWIFRTDLL